VAILGAGFGLYGYLPAVVECGERPVLPEAYRTRLAARLDVRELAGAVEWASDEAAALRGADAVIVARRPVDHQRWVERWADSNDLRRCLIEKPLAVTPVQAERILATLRGAAQVVRIGYTFRYTPWGKSLLAMAHDWPESDCLRIEWRFRAHHYATALDTWKRKISEGGGVLRFYAVHLVALLAELGYDSVLTSSLSAEHPDEAESWRARFQGPGLPACDVEVDSNSALETFRVSCGQTAVLMTDPFEASSAAGQLDRRVPILTDLCRDFLYGEDGCPSWLGRSIGLWADAERVTQPVRSASV
jgi:predicted dehydrogenase